MSITSARNFFEKSGCGTVFIVLAGLAMVLGLVYGRYGRNDDDHSATQGPVIPLITVGSHKIVESHVIKIADDTIQQRASGSEVGVSADDTAAIYASALLNDFGNTLISYLGETSGITISDEQLQSQAKEAVDAQMKQNIEMMKMRGMIKPDASPADIDAVLKQYGGGTQAEVRDAMLKQEMAQLATPEGRLQASTTLYSEKLRAHYANDIKVNDDELKKSFNTYVTKRIVVRDPSGRTQMTQKEQIAKAEQILKEIKGGLSFEAAMNKYTQDPPPAPGKPKSDSTTNLQLSIIDFDPSLAVIETLKPGEMTDVIMTSAGPTIMKLINVKSDIPGNFNEKKEELRKTEIERRADKKVRDDLLKLRDSDKVKWDSKGAHALYMWNLSQNDINYATNKVKKKEMLTEALKTVKEADEEGEEADPKWRILSSYVINKGLLDLTTGEEKKKVEADYLTAMAALPTIMDSCQLRLDLAKAYMEQKDKEASNQLLEAAATNTTTGPEAQGYYNQIVGLKGQLKKAGLLATEDETKIDTELKRWRDDVSQDLAYQSEGLIDYGPEAVTQYDAIMADVKKYQGQGWLNSEAKTRIDAAVNKWKQGAFEAVKKEAEDNKDYSVSGEATWSDINGRIQKYEAMGALSKDQVAELRKIQDAWKKAKADADAKAKADEAAKKKEEANKPATTGTGSTTGLTTGSTTGLPPSTTGLTGTTGSTTSTGVGSEPPKSNGK